MRSFLIVLMLVGICGCVQRPYYDLRQPIYFQADNSFWGGCDEFPTGYEACREYRIGQMYEGFSQWFDYFGKDNRPQAVFVPAGKKPPADRVNQIIHLGMSDGFCGKLPDGDDAGACYTWHKDFWGKPTRTRIVFKKISEIIARSLAHEFGHALGMKDNYLAPDEGSVMSYTTPTNVTSHDMKTMCKMHSECKAPKKKHKHKHKK